MEVDNYVAGFVKYFGTYFFKQFRVVGVCVAEVDVEQV
jgi:hypothetical protein